MTLREMHQFLLQNFPIDEPPTEGAAKEEARTRWLSTMIVEKTTSVNKE